MTQPQVGIGSYLAGGGLSPGGGGGRVGPTSGGAQPNVAVPWYRREGIDNRVLMEMLRQRPDLVKTLPDEVVSKFPNEFFVENPQFFSHLTPDRIQGVGKWQGTGFGLDVQQKYLKNDPSPQYSTQPVGKPTVFDDTRSQREQPQIQTTRKPLTFGQFIGGSPDRIKAAFGEGGSQVSPITSFPRLTAQKRNRLLPTEQAAVDASVRAAGINPADYAELTRRQDESAIGRGRLAGSSRAIPTVGRRY